MRQLFYKGMLSVSIDTSTSGNKTIILIKQLGQAKYPMWIEKSFSLCINGENGISFCYNIIQNLQIRNQNNN